MIHAELAPLHERVGRQSFESLPITALMVRQAGTTAEPLNARERAWTFALSAAHLGSRDLLQALVALAPFPLRPAWAHEIAAPHMRIDAHYGGVGAVTYVPLPGGAACLASGGTEDSQLRLWDPATGQPIEDVVGDHPGGIRALVASTYLPNSNKKGFLASGGNSRHVLLWEIGQTGRIGDRKQLGKHADSVWAMSTVPMPDGRLFLAVAGNGGLVRVWDLRSGYVVGSDLIGHSGRVRALAAIRSRGRVLLASGGKDSTIRLWDPEASTQVGDPLKGHSGEVCVLTAVSLSDDRDLLASGGTDGTVRLWDPDQGRIDGDPMSGPQRVLAITVIQSPDGRPLLVAGEDHGVLRLWDLFKREAVGELQTGHFSQVSAAASVQVEDRRVLVATGGREGALRLWDSSTLVEAARNNRDSVYGMRAGHKSRVRVWWQSMLRILERSLLRGRTMGPFCYGIRIPVSSMASRLRAILEAWSRSRSSLPGTEVPPAASPQRAGVGSGFGT